MVVQIIEHERDIPADVRETKIDSNSLRAPFGFKKVEDDEGWHWEPGTEADFRASESERLGVPSNQVSLRFNCYQTGPTSCAGRCGGSFPKCQLVYNPSLEYYYCTCVK